MLHILIPKHDTAYYTVPIFSSLALFTSSFTVTNYKDIFLGQKECPYLPTSCNGQLFVLEQVLMTSACPET